MASLPADCPTVAFTALGCLKARRSLSVDDMKVPALL